MTNEDCMHVCNALKDWFKSQGLKPHEAVFVAERFIANMIAANKEQDSIENILERSQHRIRSQIAIRLLTQ